MPEDSAKNATVLQVRHLDIALLINIACRIEAGWTPYQICRRLSCPMSTIERANGILESRTDAYRRAVSGLRVLPRKWVS